MTNPTQPTPSPFGQLLFDPANSDHEAIRALHERFVPRQVRYAAERSPFYRRRFAEADIDTASITSLDDLQRIPLTTKEETAEFAEEFVAAPMSEIVDVCASSGTTGRPTFFHLTRGDLRRLAHNEALGFATAGLTRDDTVLVCCTIDRCFMAGLAYFLGLETLGARAIRAGAGNPLAQWELIDRLKPTTIVGVPSLLRQMALVRGDAREAGVRRIVAIGEPVRDAELNASSLGAELGELWGASVHGTYASTEIATAFCECEAQAGGHMLPELIHVEILGDDGSPCATGEVGEVVATPLGVEGQPLLRFRTGDMSFLIEEACACGRETPRLGPIVGRRAQMMKYRGTTIYPQAIFDAVRETEGAGRCLIEVTGENALSDEIVVTVAQEDEALTVARVGDCLQARVRVKPKVVLQAPEEVERRAWADGGRKPKVFFDLRGAIDD